MYNFCTNCGCRLSNGRCPKCQPYNADVQQTSAPQNISSSQDWPQKQHESAKSDIHDVQENIQHTPHSKQSLKQPQPVTNIQPLPLPSQPELLHQSPSARSNNQPQYPQQQPPQPDPIYSQQNNQTPAPAFSPPPPVWQNTQGQVNIITKQETKKLKKLRLKQELRLIKKSHKATKRNKRKGKIVKRIIALVLTVAILSSSIWAFSAFFLKEELQILSGEGQFTTVTGKFTDIKIKNSDDAIEAAKSASQNFGILQAADELTVKNETFFDGTNYYRLQQNFNGIPVYGRDIVILAAKNGTSQGAMFNLLDIPSDFQLDTSAAHELIRKNIYRYFYDTSEIRSDYVLIPDILEDDLVIYSIDENKEVYPAYCLTVVAENKSYSVIVDSSDADILMVTPDQVNENGQNNTETNNLTYNHTMTLSFNEVQALCAEMNVKVFDAEGGDILRYFEVTDSDGSLKYYNIDTATWRNESSAPEDSYINRFFFSKASDDSDLSEVSENMDSGRRSRAKTVMCSAVNTIDFYKTALERNSFDNANSYLPIVLDDNFNGENPNNAYSTAIDSITMISIGREINVSVDLFAHEFTHSVISSECNLAYRAESGAINEGLADIFGELSEDWSDGTLDNTCDWIHGSRNLISPTSNNNPEVYEDDYWGSTYPDSEPYDYGYVHNNSTVISHAAYLMATETNETAPIPTETLAKLFYRAILTLPSNADFSCFRQYVEDNARLMKLSRTYKETIKAAFDEAGIENGATEVNNYEKDFALTVFDINSEEYTDYTLSVEGKYRAEDGSLREYREANISCDSSPMTVSLEEFGTYLLTVSDINGSDKIYSKLITIPRPDDEDIEVKHTELKILTSFGDPFFDSGSDDEDSVHLKGQLRDTITNEGIPGASVTVVMDENGTSYNLITDNNGYYQTNVKPGLYYITCNANGYNVTYSSANVYGNTTIRKPILLLWTDDRFLNNPFSNWIPTLFTYVNSLISRKIESVMWEVMDSTLGEWASEIPFLENLLSDYL